MKLKLTLALLLCAFMQMLGTQRAQAQSTTLTIDYAFDSTWTYCVAPPAGVEFFVGGTAIGYSSPADSIDVHVFYGDGVDTIMVVPFSPNGSYWAHLTHYYQTAGIYSVQYIATGPDGNADTLVNYNEVIIGTSCGNITGHLYYDANNNCVQDVSESGILWMPVELYYNSQLVQTTWTNSNGDYFFSAPTGYNFTVSVGSNYMGFTTSCPVSGNYSVTSLPSYNNDFGLSCSGGFDLAVSSSGWGFRPGMPAHVYINAANFSCNPTSGQLQLTLDPLLTYTSAIPTPASVSGNVITWNLSNLTNFAWYQYFMVNVMTSLSANIGDTVCNLATLTPVSGDNNPSNNSSMYCIDVRNSWDPNMKEVSPEGIGAAGNVAPNTTFTYTVHFQNTGSDVAYNIYVLDTLDSDLDPSTLKVTGFSHPMHMNLLPGNIMKFNFDNIMLDDSTHNEPGSHGYVTYQVKTKPGLTTGTQIQNTAHIYFDFNPAVVTNTTINTIDISLDVNDLGSSEAISIVPNPASDVIRIGFTGVAGSTEVQLLDITGRVITAKTITGNESIMEVSSIPPGVYMITVKSEKGIMQQKVIIAH